MAILSGNLGLLRFKITGTKETRGGNDEKNRYWGSSCTGNP